MGTFAHDLRQAWCSLRENGNYALAAVGSLALGLGSTIAIFSAVNGVLLTPLPYPEPDRLVTISENNEARDFDHFPVAGPNYVDWRHRNQTFAEMGAFIPSALVLANGDRPIRIDGAKVTASLLTTLGISPLGGRGFLSDEESLAGEEVVVIGERLWRQRLGGDPDIIGQTIKLDGRSHTVVGILPPAAEFPQDAEFWVPLKMDQVELQQRGRFSLSVLGRLRSDVSLPEAQMEMEAIARALEQEYPETNSCWGVTLEPLHLQLVAEFRPALLVLLAAAALIYLMACFTVANLVQVRTAARESDFAVRVAVGAGRAQIIRQILTESLLLGVLGGLVGLFLAFTALRLFPGINPYDLPGHVNISFNARVLAFSGLISVIAGLGLGLVPAALASRPRLPEALRAAARAASFPETRGRRSRLRRVLITAQISLALVALVVAGLLIRRSIAFSNVDPGFDQEEILSMRISLLQTKYPERQQQMAFFQQLISRLEVFDSVEAAAVTNSLPLTGVDPISAFVFVGRPFPQPEEIPTTHYRTVSPGYFNALGIPLVRGRNFTPDDHTESPGIAIVNETMARDFWRDDDALNDRVMLGVDRIPRQIIGIVGDVRHKSIDAKPQPEMYIPHSQGSRLTMELVLRSSSDPTTLIETARSEILSLDKELPISHIHTMEELRTDSLAKPRFTMLLLTGFAANAFLLSAVGIYSVVSNSLLWRSREFGLRMALGARPKDVIQLVIRQETVAPVIGVAIGLLFAYLLTRTLSGPLQGINPKDTVTFLVMALILAGVALAITLVSARRWTGKMGSATVLRCE